MGRFTKSAKPKYGLSAVASHPSRFVRTLQAQQRVTNPYLLCAMVGRRARQSAQAADAPRIHQAINRALEEVAAGQLRLADPGPTGQITKQRKAEASGAEVSAEQVPQQAAQVESDSKRL